MTDKKMMSNPMVYSNVDQLGITKLKNYVSRVICVQI